MQGGLGSNGDITIKNNATICGPVTPGPGQQFNQGNNNSFCGNTPAPATLPFSFQPVDLSSVSVTNDNVPPHQHEERLGGAAGHLHQLRPDLWNVATRVLTLDGNATLDAVGRQLSALPPGAAPQQLPPPDRRPLDTLKMYMDAPENCPGVTGAGGADMSGRVINLNTNPATFALMVAGSSTVATAVDLFDGAVTAIDAPMAIYAPNSTVDFKNNLDFKGSLVVKTIKVKNNADIDYDTRIGDIASGSSIRHYDYGTGSYRECTSAPAAAVPDSGC